MMILVTLMKHRQLFLKAWIQKTLGVMLVLFLSACSLLYQIKIIDGFVVGSDELIGANIQFDRVVIQRLFESDQVYQVNSEQELALLIIKKVEMGELTITYLSDHPLNMQQVYLYVELLLAESFYIQAGSISYKDEKGDEFIKINFVDVIYDKVFYTSANLLAKQILDELDVYNLDTKAQIKAIYQYLIEFVEYDESVLSLNLTQYQQHPAFSGYGALFYQSAVCSGYARAFMLLAHQLNIPTTMVNVQSIQHAWNMVYVDGEWLYVDVTWDDQLLEQANLKNTYFLKSYQDFIKDGLHVFDEASDTTLTQAQIVDFAKFAFNK